MPKERLDAPKGLLHPGPTEVTVARYVPSDRLASFVEHLWIVRLHLETGSSMVSELTYPSVQLVIECDQTATMSHVVGVMTGRFTKHLEGQGHILGIKFRPAGFYPIVRAPVTIFTDQRLPLQEFFGSRADDLERTVREARDDATMVNLAEAFLESILPAADDKMRLVNEIVDWIGDNPTAARVDTIAVRFGMSKRTLQRLFYQYVGVSPKSVIQRHRLLAAVEELPSYRGGDVGLLAADLGYFDQSHFAKEFKMTVGTTPAEYARRSTC